MILIPCGSLRSRSFSRLSCAEAGRLLTRLGAEARFFNPSGLLLVDDDVMRGDAPAVLCAARRDGGPDQGGP